MSEAGAHPARWQRVVAAAPQNASLAEGALLIAAEEYESLDVDGYLAKLEAMGAALHRRLRSDISPTEALLALNRYLFDELGFSGNAQDYYDLRNSYLNEVIDRRLGIPITLAIVYIEVGRRISAVLGPHDTVARLGGDEFAVLLERMPSAAHAEEVATRLLDVLGRPILVAGRELFPSASIGIALWGPGYQHGEELLRDADAAMYRDKLTPRLLP